MQGLSFRVRNGTGRLTLAMAAANLVDLPRDIPGGSDRDGPGTGQWTRKSLVTHSGRSLPWGIIRRTQYGPPPGTRMMEYDCLSPVSTGQLHPLRGFHVRPIDHVFYMGGRAARGREES